jgi:tRNA threonylcarbamoyladenosine biosynthesis protein TsaE
MRPADLGDDHQSADARPPARHSDVLPCLTVVAATAEATASLGESLGRYARPGDLILLRGPIGAGKTTFTQGLARGMGIQARVTSPSFTLANVYDERREAPLYHLDLWRMRSSAEALGIGLEEYLSDDGVCVVEWPEIAEDVLPGEFLRVGFELAGEGRQIEICPFGERPRKLIEELRAAIGASVGGTLGGERAPGD